MNLSQRLARFTVARPGRVLLLAVLISLAIAPLVLRLRFDTDLIGLFPRRSAEAEAFTRYSRNFLGEKLLLVLVESETADALPPFLDAYAAALRRDAAVDEVRHRLSAEAALYLRDHLFQLLADPELRLLAERSQPEALPARARRLRSLLSAPGGSALTPILTADPFELLESLSARMKSGLPVDTQSGYFRSADGKAGLIFVRPKANAFDIEGSRAILARATQTAIELGASVAQDGIFVHRSKIEVGFTGATAFGVTYRDWLHDDTTRATALSGVAVLVLFAFFFRTLRVLPLVALPLAFGLWWTGALAVVLYQHVNAVSLAFGTILVSIGIDLPIQLFNRLREELQGRPAKEALEATMADLIRPSLLATLGTGAVFLACALSNYRGLAELGVLAAAGLLFNFVAMVTVFPALLAALPESWWARSSGRDLVGPILGGLAGVLTRKPRLVLGLVALLGAAAIPIALRVQFERRLITIQPEAMPPMRVERELESRFGERELVFVLLIEDADPDAALQKNDGWPVLLEPLRQQGLITGFQTAAVLIPSQKLQAERRARIEALDPKRVADGLRAALVEVGFDTAAFEPVLQQLQTPPRPITVEALRDGPLDFLVRTHVQDDREHGLRRLASFAYAPRKNAEAAEAALNVAAKQVGGLVTGSPILERALYEIVRRDTAVVTGASTLLVLVLLLLYYRAARPWLAVILPLLFAWVLFAAALVLLGWPLNLFNLLAVPLVIGYGIDDHIFLVHRHDADHRHDPLTTPAATARSVGRAVAVTSLATIAGFLPLGFARFEGLRLLGLSGALAVGLCLIAATIVLPPLLAILYPTRTAETAE